jgi:hypothetical protein
LRFRQSEFANSGMGFANPCFLLYFIVWTIANLEGKNEYGFSRIQRK